MADIVNLRQMRKHKARLDKDRLAEQNRTLHGRTKAEKLRDALSSEKALTFIEGHRREPGQEARREIAQETDRDGDA